MQKSASGSKFTYGNGINAFSRVPTAAFENSGAASGNVDYRPRCKKLGITDGSKQAISGEWPCRWHWRTTKTAQVMATGKPLKYLRCKLPPDTFGLREK